MAKQPLANQQVPGFAGHSGQKQLVFFVVLGLSLLALLVLVFSQLSTTYAQAAPGSLNFGSQQVNTTSAPKSSTFTNSTGTTATVTSNLTNGIDFAYAGSGNGCNGVVLDNGESCSVGVAFTPKSEGAKSGSVDFTATYDSASVTPSGIGVLPRKNATTSSSTSLSGNAFLPATATVPATATRVPPPCNSQIQGYVVVDGKPGVGQVVKLEGPSTAQVTVGEGGFFYFNNLCAGTFKLSLVYDRAKYTVNTPDSYTIKTDGVNAYRDNAFGLVTIPATTAVATTAAPTTAAPTSGAPTTAAPTTPPATTPPTAASCPSDTFSAPSGTKLRLGTQVVKVNNTQFLLCMGVAAGDVPVDLNDTVIINLPAGAVVTQATANLGTVTTSGNTVRWGSFSLNAKQSADLVLSINSPSGSLTGSSVFVSGSFNRSQTFQQRIPGLPSLIDISPAVPATQGGQGGGNPVIPSAAPATGTGAENSQDSPAFLLILAVIASASLGIGGLFLTGRANKRPNNKEQK